jgi:hypothetical protein
VCNRDTPWCLRFEDFNFISSHIQIKHFLLLVLNHRSELLTLFTVPKSTLGVTLTEDGATFTFPAFKSGSPATLFLFFHWLSIDNLLSSSFVKQVCHVIHNYATRLRMTNCCLVLFLHTRDIINALSCQSAESCWSLRRISRLSLYRGLGSDVVSWVSIRISAVDSIVV